MNKNKEWSKEYDEEAQSIGLDLDQCSRMGMFIHSKITQAEDNMRKRCLEEILDRGHYWFETHFTPEDPDDGIFTGIQEHMGEREFIKVVQDQAAQNINNLDKGK